jgi:hypothetical protein
MMQLETQIQFLEKFEKTGGDLLMVKRRLFKDFQGYRYRVNRKTKKREYCKRKGKYVR